MEPSIQRATDSDGCYVAAISDDGCRAAASDADVVRVLAGHVLMPATHVVAAAIVEGMTWIVTCEATQHVLHRFDDAGLRVGAPMPLGALGPDVVMSATRTGARTALVEGARGVFVSERSGEVWVDSLGDCGRDRRVLVGARGVLERRGATLVFARASTSTALTLPADLSRAIVVGGTIVLDGTALLIELELASRRLAVVFDLRRGVVKSRIRLGEAQILATAERRGIVVLGRGPHLALLDLRAGGCTGERIMPAAVAACAIDADATRLVVVDVTGRSCELGPSMKDHDPGLEPGASREAEPEAPAIPSPPPIAANDSIEAIAELASTSAPIEPPGSEAAACDAPAELAATTPRHLLALGPIPGRVLAGESLDDYLAGARAWIESLGRTALAVAGSGDPGGEAIARARDQEREAAARFACWNRPGSPHVEIARELALSPMAMTLLLITAAPQIWGELAPLYGRCTADPARPLVDELLLAHLLEAKTSTRSQIGRELDDDAPLIRSGAIEMGPGLRPYAAISVHPVIARRLAGGPTPCDPEHEGPAEVPELGEVLGPRDAIAALAHQLAETGRAPVRVVLRGRPGAGRRTLAAALASRAGRRLGMIADLAAVPDLEVRLRQRLREIALRGDLPCVTVDDLADDQSVRARVRSVLDAHAGPLFVRAPRGGELPIAPGHQAIDFAPLGESERCAAWQRTLAAHDLDPAVGATLAARFAVGPGVMTRACAAVAQPAPARLEPALITALRQHRSARIEAIATRVERLADWDDLVVPDEIGDALRELCARARHRRTVLEEWGLDRVAATAQGVTALLQGGPGTGKTMAAGVIARCLGYELWRVDLSKIVSKWIGETEKNLAAVFDAAEEGEIVVLFDEADALFGKRTEVRSSHDRNANLETNYLLQRLDSFTGIAILTTNHATSIDPAFKRRLSVHVQFPFPDHADRERLWRAHLPPSLPLGGELDLPGLARKYQLSGGHIRNAVLRAAYLAAGAGQRLGADHLHRAVALEYERAGKLGDGRLE